MFLARYKYFILGASCLAGIAALLEYQFRSPVKPVARIYPKTVSRSYNVLLVGGSGAVGEPTVQHLLKNDRLEKLTLVARKKQEGITDPRVDHVVVNFDKLSDVNLSTTYDAIVSTMGTTRAQCRDAAEYRKIEVDYPTEFAKLGKKAGAKVTLPLFPL